MGGTLIPTQTDPGDRKVQMNGGYVRVCPVKCDYSILWIDLAFWKLIQRCNFSFLKITDSDWKLLKDDGGDGLHADNQESH